MSTGKTITLAHGNGGKLAHELISSLMVPAFGNPELRAMGDSAVIHLPAQPGGSGALAFTTDSYVVSPVFFPGGDIGKLSVCGTVNDLAVMGARPQFISCAMIIEEGFALTDLERIVNSISDTAREAGVRVVTGDTKVVGRGAADGIFINTAGIGVLLAGAPVGMDAAQPGDAVIVSGTIGDHGIAIYAGREGIDFKTGLRSDCAPLVALTERAMGACSSIRVMRDPTRGGLATTLNEFVERRGFGIELFEDRVPVREEVQAACSLLGFDPLYVANEGKLVLVVPSPDADAVVAALRSHEFGRDAAIVGRVTDRAPGRVFLRTAVGGERIIDMLTGEMLPRIC